MKYKLIIFDMDGTTLYTIEDLANSLNYALEKSKLPTRSLPEVLRFVGNGIRRLIERAVPESSSEEIIETVYANFTEHYTIHCADTTRPYDGIIELLKALKEKGFLTAIVSNKADYAVQALCKDYFPNLFDAIAGEKQGVNKKPAPDMVNNILKLLNLSAHDAVYVGDSEVDVQTAKNSNMDCIAVDWGFRTRDELIEAGATVIVSTPDEILGKIE